MAKRKPVKVIKAEAEEYARTVETVNVLPAALQVGMINVRQSGARYRYTAVGLESLHPRHQETATSLLKAWEERGLETAGAVFTEWVRIDTWGLPGAEYETDVVMCVIPPNVVDVPQRIERESVEVAR